MIALRPVVELALLTGEDPVRLHGGARGGEHPRVEDLLYVFLMFSF